MTKQGTGVAVQSDVDAPGLWEWFNAPDFGRWFDVRPLLGRFERMRLEQELKDDTLVVRAEIPGIDPEKDVEITLDEGVLRIKAERRSETKEEKEGSFFSEFRYGSFERAVRVPRETLHGRREGQLQRRHPRGDVPLQGAHGDVANEGRGHPRVTPA